MPLSFNYHPRFICDLVTRWRNAYLPPLALCCRVIIDDQSQSYIHRGLYLQLPKQDIHLHMLALIYTCSQYEIQRMKILNILKFLSSAQGYWTFRHYVTRSAYKPWTVVEEQGHFTSEYNRETYFL